MPVIFDDEEVAPSAVPKVIFDEEEHSTVTPPSLSTEVLPPGSPRIAGPRPLTAFEAGPSNAITQAEQERLASGPPLSREEIKEAITDLATQGVPIPPFGAEGTFERGVSKTLAGVANFATSPVGIGLAGAAAIPGVGPALTGYFLGDVTKSAAEKAGEAVVTGNKETIGEAATLGAMSGLIGRHMFKSAAEANIPARRLASEIERSPLENVPRGTFPPVPFVEPSAMARVQPPSMLEPPPRPSITPLTDRAMAESDAVLGARAADIARQTVETERIAQTRAEMEVEAARIVESERKVIFDEEIQAKEQEAQRVLTTEVPSADQIQSPMEAVRRETPGTAPPMAEGAPGQLPRTAELLRAEEAKTPPPLPIEQSLPKWTDATSLREDIVADVKSAMPKQEPIGVAVPGTAAAQKAIGFLKSVTKDALEIPKMNDFRRSVLDWSAKLQKSFGEIREAQESIKSIARKPVEREAITNWIEAGGDDAVLAAREAATGDPKLKEGYAAARRLTPEQLRVANEVKAAFDALFQRGQRYDVLNSFRENYTPHIWNTGGGPLTRGLGRLQDSFRFSKARTFETFFQGETAGFKPKTKDIAKLLPVYLHEMNNAIASKQLVENLSKGVASDGRPLVIPRGIASVVEGDAGKATLVMPKVSRDAATHDYKVLDQPALHDWRWVSKDDAGNPVFLKSDLALHPEAYNRLRNILGKSEIRNWYNQPTTPLAEVPKLLAKALDSAQSEAKRTMLGFLSTFHQVQEGTHAIGHRVNPFSDIPKIDLARDPGQMDAARHGLMLNPDRISERFFMEGVGQTGLMSKVPGFGKLADAYASYLFHDYIPGLKYKTYADIVKRNEHVYTKELASGAVKPEDVKLLSAEQTNAAYGHLNYADMARNPTLQHLLQLGLLAPDFLEARGRFAAQAGKALLGNKSGREQLAALGFLAALQFGGMKIINKLVDDDWHFDHPFEVVTGNRRYAFRSVPEDIYNLVKDTRQFAYSRLNPVVGKGAVQGITGVNYRGEKTTFPETLAEMATSYIPITLRWLPGLKDLTETSRNRPVSPWEQFLGSMGIRISRYSPVTEIYKLASDWNEKQGKAKDRGTYPISKYQQLRYALEDGDFDKAREEVQKLIDGGMTRSKVSSGFAESINHPFTGSAASDKQFKESLDEKQQLLYQSAIDKRKDILTKYRSL